MLKPRLSVFISHSTVDKKISQDIYDTVIKNASFAWMDTVELIPGTELLPRINEGIDRAQILIIIVSKNSLNSNWVNYEWTTYVHKKLSDKSEIYLLPILVEDLRLPPSLSRYKYLKTTGASDYLIEISKSVQHIAVDYVERKRGFRLLLSEYTERVKDNETTLIIQKKVFLPVGKLFKEKDLHHWQDSKGEISIVRLKFYDNTTGDTLEFKKRIIQHDENNLVVNCTLNEEFNNVIMFLSELKTTNYFPNLYSGGTGYTELVVLYPCNEVKYNFIVPNKSPYNELQVTTNYGEGCVLSSKIIGDEIIHFFSAHNVGYEDTLRFTMIKK